MSDHGRGEPPAPATPNDAAVDTLPLALGSLVSGACPYLLSADGGWRSATAVREHRCTAVAPPAPLAAEKQRRLCLTDAHRQCATYVAAVDARPVVRRLPHRAIARTTPVVLDQHRITNALPALRSSSEAGQGILIGVLGLAFVAVLVARLATSGAAPGAAGPFGSTSPTPSATAVAVASASSSPSTARASATASDAPASVSPSPSPTLVPTGGSPSPAATPASPRSYTVRSGDTLSGIAARFGTTVKVLTQLNSIADPRRIHPGQVLRLP